MAPEAPLRAREHWLVLLVACALPVALLTLGRWLDPDPRGWGTHEQLGFRPCYPMSQWNLPCPGCGVTTAVALAAHGQPLAALRTQPFGPLLLVALLTFAGWALREHARGRDLVAGLARLPWRVFGKTLGTLGMLAWLYKIAVVRGWF